MRITELLSNKGIELGAKVDSKDEAIKILVGLHNKVGNITDKDEFEKGIREREASSSTAVGDGIAIPHTKNKAVKKAGLVAMTVPDGVEYEALDGQPSKLFFMIAAPEDGGDVHLEVLSRLMVLLMDESFRNKLLDSTTTEEFLKNIDEMEMEKYPEEDKKNIVGDVKYRILAVTACPTGIAHTYMAAEALEKAGEKLGYSIKVETNGSGGGR